jgi:hypothetical protein
MQAGRRSSVFQHRRSQSSHTNRSLGEDRPSPDMLVCPTIRENWISTAPSPNVSAWGVTQTRPALFGEGPHQLRGSGDRGEPFIRHLWPMTFALDVRPLVISRTRSGTGTSGGATIGDLPAEGRPEFWLVLAERWRRLRAIAATARPIVIVNASQLAVCDRAAQAGMGLSW